MVSIFKMLSFELNITSVFKKKATEVKAEWKKELRKMEFGESSHRKQVTGKMC